MRPRIVLTMGDPAGVGPELVLRTLADGALADSYDLSVVGDVRALAFWSKHLSLPPAGRIVDVGGRMGAIRPGIPEPEGAAASLRSIERAAELCMSGEADAMVTGPVSKAAIQSTGRAFVGHTEFLAEFTGTTHYLMTFVHEDVRIALATTHLPLSRVPPTLTPELIISKLITLDRGLRDWFGVLRPRIAVCALNPHAGEGGAFGSEEETAIAPAIESARAGGILASGPFSADALFLTRSSGGPGLSEPDASFDATLAMYHDQGTIPAKMLGAGAGVNVTLGLPIVRTSVDHGTAFDIAGRGDASTSSITAAVRLAGGIAERVGGRHPHHEGDSR